jgi:2-hydroxychromene-2-carboxylate isomerase
MSLSVEVFYSFQSPYSYLALESIYNLEDKYEISLIWHPFSAKAAGQPITPSPIVPDKLSYLFEDTARFAKEHNIPLKYPEAWPEIEFDPNRPTRGAVVAADMSVLKEYNYKCFHKWWGMGENPNEDEFVNELCDQLDIDAGEFISRLSSSETRERVKGIYKRGRKLGIFDTPTIVIDKERLFGLDKLPYLDGRLEAMGLRRK